MLLNTGEVAHLHRILVDNLTTTFRQQDALCQAIESEAKAILLSSFVPTPLQRELLLVLRDLYMAASSRGESARPCPLPDLPAVDRLVTLGLISLSRPGYYTITELRLQQVSQ